MERIAALEGLRGWLAFGVLASHIVQASELYRTSRLADLLFWSGERFVEVFMILSGFVITHLLLARDEPYRAFLTRRVFRLLPVFVVCCIIGAVVTPLAAQAVAGQTGSHWADLLRGFASSQAEHWPWHVILHLTMLHGLVPNTVLPASQYMFSPPGWSVSLEWQFYVLAPGLIWFWRKPGAVAALTLVAVISYWSFQYLLQVQPQLWTNWSVLPPSLIFFLLGIGSRFAAPALAGRVRQPTALAIGFLGVSMLFAAPAFGMWLAVLCYLWADRPNADRIDQAALAFGDAVFTSNAALYVGARSYSVYLVHFPLLMVATILFSGMPGYSPWHKTALFAALVVPGTIMVSHLLYRYVEKPFISIGGSVARGGLRHA
jgi:peptidoglycan/LPS O-acetylase OafA/YrhL